MKKIHNNKTEYFLLNFLNGYINSAFQDYWNISGLNRLPNEINLLKNEINRLKIQIDFIRLSSNHLTNSSQIDEIFFINERFEIIEETLKNITNNDKVIYLFLFFIYYSSIFLINYYYFIVIWISNNK